MFVQIVYLFLACFVSSNNFIDTKVWSPSLLFLRFLLSVNEPVVLLVDDFDTTSRCH